MLTTIVILAGCTVDDITRVPGRDDAPVSTSVPATDFSSTPYPVEDFDLDGDGRLGPAEVKAAVISQSGAYEFAPGYEFDTTRFGLDIDRILSTDWRTFSFDYPEAVLVPPQACSWVQYWLDSVTEGDIEASDDALAMMQNLSGQEALGDLAGPYDAMISAAAEGDVESVQSIFTGANCHIRFFVPDDFGPQGSANRGYW